MKTIYYLSTLLLFPVFLNKNFGNTAFHDQPVVVICENRVHLLMDETPNAPIVLELRDATGRVWHTHTFTLDSEYWFTEMPFLPAGKFSIYIGAQKVADYHKQQADVGYQLKKSQTK